MTVLAQTLLAEILLAVLWVGLMLYALFGGADFGAGFWDLLAGGDRKGARQRALIEHSISPVWEANHVWLIFVLVVLWTGFPAVFAAVMSTLYVPLTLAVFGIIARGAAFAYRKSSTELWQQRAFGAAFALASVVTPFFMGTVAGAIVSGRVPAGLARGNVLGAWTGPTSLLGGVLAVVTCAYLAAVFLCGDARRQGAEDLAEAFRLRAALSGVVAGILALGGIGVLAFDAPRLSAGLLDRGWPLVAVSGLAGLASLALLVRRRYALVRITSGLAVAMVLWGWALGQYPYLLEPNVTYAAAAADPAVLAALLVAIGVGLVLLAPSLGWLYLLFQRAHPSGARGNGRDE